MIIFLKSKEKINISKLGIKFVFIAIRKRVYAHNENSCRVDDCLIEDIEEYYTYLESKNQDTCESPVKRQKLSHPKAYIHNLVGTSKIESSVKFFDLEVISRIIPNCTYDKQKFAAITIRLKNPMCTVLLFTSGKMVITGCKNFVGCCMASLNVTRHLRLAIPQFNFNLKDVTIQNIVGNVDLMLNNGELKLDAFYKQHSMYCTFQRNMFPGLIYRANNSPVVLLLFQSGRIVITGGKSRQDVTEGWKQLWPTVRPFIVDN